MPSRWARRVPRVIAASAPNPSALTTKRMGVSESGASTVLLADFSLQSRAILTNLPTAIRVGQRPPSISSTSPGACPIIAWPTVCACAPSRRPTCTGRWWLSTCGPAHATSGRANNGLSHFVEHMLFRGCAQYPNSFALNRAIEERCGCSSGRRDATIPSIRYRCTRAISGALSTFWATSSWRRAFLTSISNAPSCSKRSSTISTNEGHRINTDDLARETLWSGHPLGFPITGPERNIRRFSRADVVRHFRRLYGARNMVLCVAGPVRRAAVLAQVRRAFGHLPPGRRLRPLPPPARLERTTLPHRAQRFGTGRDSDPVSRLGRSGSGLRRAHCPVAGAG
jgi:hypothetical protein